jgi:hypothetical protein
MEEAMTSPRRYSFSSIVAPRVASGIVALAMAPANAVNAFAHDRDGFVTPDDAACWTEAACALPRGGDSGVMTVYAPDGTVFAQAFAFGAEQFTQLTANVYYFDPTGVPVDVSMVGLPSGLVRPAPPGQLRILGAVFGIAETPMGPALAFSRDWPFLDESYWPIAFPPGVDRFGCPQSPFNPPGTKVQECPDIPNPAPGPGSSNGDFLTIAYDATPYLSPDFRLAGYTADFRTDTGSVPSPGTFALFGLGLLVLGAIKVR